VNDVCIHCGMTFRRAILLAMLEDAGAKVYPNSLQCADGQEHDFRNRDEAQHRCAEVGAA